MGILCSQQQVINGNPLYKATSNGEQPACSFNLTGNKQFSKQNNWKKTMLIDKIITKLKRTQMEHKMKLCKNVFKRKTLEKKKKKRIVNAMHAKKTTKCKNGMNGSVGEIKTAPRN